MLLMTWISHFFCIYAPSQVNLQKNFFTNLFSMVRGHVLLIGDFNSVTDSSDQLSGHLDSTSELLGQLLSAHNLYEPRGSHLAMFTYHHQTLAICKSCIDRAYIYFPSKWVGYASPTPYSDHYMVGLFVPKPIDLAPKAWQFPSNLLSQEDFCSQSQLLFNCFNKNDSVNSWEIIKLCLQERAQQATLFRQ